MIRPLAVILAALLLAAFNVSWAAAQEAAAASPKAQIEVELRLERKLLVLDLAGYDEARTRERQARSRVDEVSSRLDEMLQGDSLSLGGLEALRDELDAARESAQTAASRVDGQVRRLEERLQRIGFLEGEMGGQPVRRTDPISGRWRVRVQPGDRSGTFEMRLAGTVVTGTYQIDGVGSGSLRGTYTGNALRLERVDSRRGFDSVFEGSLTGDGLLSGLWTANELAGGDAARGGWTAVRVGGNGGNEGER
jgi:hypothetical protein